MSKKTQKTVVLSARGAGTKKVEVGSYKEASEVWITFRDEHNLGAGDMNRNCGNIYIDRKKVGHVSYNGRVWDNKDQEINMEQTELPDVPINAADTTLALLSDFDAFAKEQKLSGKWALHQTGGFCMVATCEVTLGDGRAISLGVNNENICLYSYSWLKDATEEEFNSDTIFDWCRGGNPAELIHKINEHITQPENHHMLFDEIMTVMHSDHF